MERDESTLFSAIMVEVWMTKGEMGDEDENDMESASRPEKSVV